VDRSNRNLNFQSLLWVGLVILFVGLVYFFWPRGVSQPPVRSAMALSQSIPLRQATSTFTAPTPTPVKKTPAAIAANVSASPTAPSGGVSGVLVPPPESVGWATSLDGRSHLGFPNIHAGFLNGQAYYGALQFDLSMIPPGSTITYAALELTGLDAQYLNPGGNWRLKLLDAAIDETWPELTFELLQRAAVETTMSPTLTSTDLDQNRINLFNFNPEQLVLLEQRLSNGVASFRLDGPTSGKDNLFTWDSGSRGIEVSETRPKLRLIVVPPPPPEYVIVTSTPTPENVITAAALAVTATKVAQTIGTYTPVPENWVTPMVVTAQPTPANPATAAHQRAIATAETFLFGTATATPVNVWTATPTPSNIVSSRTSPLAETTALSTPTRSQFVIPNSPNSNYVIVTSTPTPENVITAAAIAVKATEVARTVGTYTPVPENWVTPVIVTPQPTPANPATATHQEAMATAEALLFGTATPTPMNVWTATPTPVFTLLNGEVATPWLTPTPTATPQPIPDVLVGKIAFLSNRSGGPEPLKEPLVYVVDPDGSNLALLTDRAVYDAAVARDGYSADQRFRVFVKNARRFDNEQVPALYIYDYFYDVEQQITQFGAGAAWDPVWSPAREQIAFVSNDSGDDEIWVINGDGSGPLQLTQSNADYNAREIGKDTFVPEINGHPSWSPDGSQIVFWSNRTGNRQIWVMNADGTGLHSFSTTNHDDWNPIWIKYPDPARDPVPDIANGPSVGN
jgi:hypothetical protein